MIHIDYYKNCNLCGRHCGVDRARVLGFCRCFTDVKVARIGLHLWEEPIISGANGSGTIFFSGCSLGCIYCQNREISRAPVGKTKSVDEIAFAMLELEKQGAHNINFVTPTHFAPAVASAVDLSRSEGLKIPIVYNTSSYDSIETLAMLEGKVDIYLADLKYYKPQSASKLSLAENYPEIARTAIAEMVRQQPKPVIENGIMKRGVIVRVLLLPLHVAEAKLSLKYLYETYGDNIYISLMSQYTPLSDMPAPLNRRVSSMEYDELVEYADKIGVKNAFIQERSSSVSDYIPEFDIST